MPSLERTRLSVPGLPPYLCWREVKGFLFPEAWHYPSIHLTNGMLEASKTCWKQRIFSALLSLSAHSFSVFSTDYASISGVERLSGKLSVNAVSVWVLAKTRLLPAQCVREGDSRFESRNVCVSVCTHHSSSILPALAWTSFLRGPSASFPLFPGDIAIQSEFLMSLHSEIILRTDKPDTFVFCSQSNLRYSMT